MRGGRSDDIDHPLVFLLNLGLQGFMLLGVLPLLVWLVTSIFATPGYLKWVLDTEASMNEAMLIYRFGFGDGKAFALEQAVILTEDVLPGVHNLEAPGGGRAVRQGGQQNGSMASSLHQDFNRWMAETFVPAQRYYLPLLLVRGLVVAGAALAMFLPILAGSYRGQAERRRLVAKGMLLKPHRYMIYKTGLTLVASLFFAYPAYPVPIPVYVMVPVAALLLHELGRKTSASMMEL